MDVEFYQCARKTILITLAKRQKWGGSHTPFKRMFANFSKDERGKKEVKQAAADLIKEGKIMLKQTVEDDHVSLNPRMLKEIRSEIGGV